MTASLQIDVLSIFPQYLAPLELSLVGKAQQAGILEMRVRDLRDWTTDRHKTVDDTPYGGGAGMVMKPNVWGEAIAEVLAAPAGHVPSVSGNTLRNDSTALGQDIRPVLIIPTPGGTPFTQGVAQELANRESLIFACGRYEGIDARVAQYFREESSIPCEVREISIGDYVLNGGEVAALVLIEAIVRLIPGVIGNPESLVEESHAGDGLLEYPVYTKPVKWENFAVPEVLTSGDHGKIARWRRDESLRCTARIRPDLIFALPVGDTDDHDRAVLREVGIDVIDGRFQIVI